MLKLLLFGCCEFEPMCSFSRRAPGGSLPARGRSSGPGVRGHEATNAAERTSSSLLRLQHS